MATKRWQDEYDPEIVERVEHRDYSTGGADAVRLSDEDYARVLYNQSLWNEADEGGRAALHDQTEQIRSNYGYSGGTAGIEYVPTTGKFTYEQAPAYVDRYQDQLNALSQQILGRQPFSYDLESDPVWQAYKDQYTREGARAMEDTIGRLSGRTGGLASSYAATAAQQANDYYMQQMTDKIPELYKLAYDMYMSDADRDRQNLSMLMGLSDSDYNRYLNALSQWNTNRNFAYGLQQDEYQRAQDEYQRQLALAQLGAGYGDYAGLSALGINPNADALLQMTLAGNGRTVPIGSGGSGGGGGGGGSGGGKPTLTVAQVNSAIKNGTITDKVLEAYEYYYGEPYNGETEGPMSYLQMVASAPDGMNEGQAKDWFLDHNVKSTDVDDYVESYMRQQSEQSSGAVSEDEVDQGGILSGVGSWLNGLFGGGRSNGGNLSKEAQALAGRYYDESGSTGWMNSVLSAYETGRITKSEMEYLMNLADF